MRSFLLLSCSLAAANAVGVPTSVARLDLGGEDAHDLAHERLLDSEFVSRGVRHQVACCGISNL